MPNLTHAIKQFFPSEMLYFVEQVAALADHEGQRAVLVGGVVRDLLLKKSVKDADIMLEAPLEKIVEKIAQKSRGELIAHPRFLTFTVKVSKQLKVDFVTAREETYREPAALPDVKAATIEKDFRRRDFTVNAMACWINKPRFGELLDPLDGKKDLDTELIRILHPLSFQDDPTRIYRAARFAGRLSFSLEKTTIDLIERAVKESYLMRLSPVRRRHELEMILKESDPVPALQSLEKWGALDSFYKGCRLSEHQIDHLPKSGQDLSGDELLAVRLKIWLHDLDPKKGRTVLDQLEFERHIKSKIYST